MISISSALAGGLQVGRVMCPALRLVRILLFMLLFLAAVSGPLAQSESSGLRPSLDAILDQSRSSVDKLQKQLEKIGDEPLSDAKLVELRDAALNAQSSADEVADTLAPQLAGLQARLAELGPPPESGEPSDVANQRAELSRSAATLDAQIKLARLVEVEAAQAVERIGRLRRAQFQAHLGRRTTPIVDARFWDEWLREWRKDSERLMVLYRDVGQALGKTPPRYIVALAAAVGALLLAQWAMGRVLIRFTSTHVTPGRLRRSLYALAQAGLSTMVPIACAWVLNWTLTTNGRPSGNLEAAMGWLIIASGFGGVVAGVGKALLSARRPTWRLPLMLDEVAWGLRWFPTLLGWLTGAGWLALNVFGLTNISLASTVALDYATSLLTGALLWSGLILARRLRLRAHLDPNRSDPPAYPIWLTLFVMATWSALVMSLVCLLVGYVALGSFIIRQIVWVGLVLGLAYLISSFIRDIGDSLVSYIERNAVDYDAEHSWSRTRSQVVVLLSGVLRVGTGLVAIVLLLSQFGDGPAELVRRVRQLYEGIPLGQIHFRPTAILMSIVVLFGGFGAVKILQRWLANQYFPTTSLDPGMRLSATTLFGYAGYVLVVALALVAAGIGLERVAWIASALSVGIGFGLQAVVQNFVSGLILLAERPVKVGDWVSLGGVEGDIRRINVRATEIQMGDRSTVIVPNSEFITKVVRNVTHANPLGRVQIKFAMPANVDAVRVRGLILSAYGANTEILQEPAPEVVLDGIDASGLQFNATGYVTSPRKAGQVKSELLFDVLERLRQAGLPLASPATVWLREPSAHDVSQLRNTV